ncbi:MAG TPA: glycosyltransferase family 39 protein [Steroidobacteraceae bacterium]|nr:glycosyltransferase family 39 protein [Steroidobacteraceae bacterium]
MSDRAQVWSGVLLLLALAAALRFSDLGAWPYSGDETATLEEERALFHTAGAPPASPSYRLSHAIPLSYLAFHVSHTLFGDTERGTRVVVATLGCLSVVLVFLLLDGPLPRATAIVAALLVALMPQHVLHSQETRFYMVAAFFGFVALLTGGRILERHSELFAALTSCLIFLAMLCHTLLVVLLPLVFLAICAGFYARGQLVPRAVLLIFGIAAAAMALFATVYLRPLLQGWNQTESWGYSPSHALLASIVMIGWPTTLLAVVGCVLMIRERTSQGWYWPVCLLGWVGATLTLPLVVPYHAEYVFPLALAGVVPAAYAIGVIYELLRPRTRWAAYAWLGLSCLTNLPALASYYVDGSRWNMRDAAAYVRQHWSPGDRVAGYSVGLFRHYSDGCCEPAIALRPDSAAQLARLAAEGGRLWVVLENTRSGLPPQVQRWLFDCAVHKLSVGGRRFDDAEFRVEVYLVPRSPESGCTRRPT